jgi:fructose-1,6-bisphosphatase I
MITLDRFILEEERQHPGATGELSMLLMRFGVAGKRIAWELSVGGLRSGLGAAGSTNVQGEEQQKLDVLANEILLETFDYGGLVSIAASEEMAEPFIYERNAEQGRYAILFDPMDGSSNIGVNGTLGTIFSVRQRGRGEVDLLRSGREQVAAGYILFGPATLLVYTCGEDVRLFTLEPSIGEFLLTSSSVRMPPRGRGYAVNEGRSGAWAPETRAFVEHLKQSDEAAGRPYSTRYSASLVADPARRRHLPLSRDGRQAVREAACALRVSPSRLRRRARWRRRDDRPRSGPRRRPRIAPRPHPLRDRERPGDRPLRPLSKRPGPGLRTG